MEIFLCRPNYLATPGFLLVIYLRRNDLACDEFYNRSLLEISPFRHNTCAGRKTRTAKDKPNTAILTSSQFYARLIIPLLLWALGTTSSFHYVYRVYEYSNYHRSSPTSQLVNHHQSQRALRAIALPFTSQENRFLRSLVYQKTEVLQRAGHHIVIQWVPGHSGLIGNEKANLSARNRAEKGGKLTECWSSLAYIKRNVCEMRLRELVRWHETVTQEREASRCGLYIPRTIEGISSALGNGPKKYASRYYQLKVGHGAVGTFLVRIGVIETPECWWRGAAEQTVQHLYARCRKWRKQRKKHIRQLEKEKTGWQPQVERKWLANLLGNEKARTPCLKFLKATGIGGREGAKERELEWARQNDQAGEDLLD